MFSLIYGDYDFFTNDPDPFTQTPDSRDKLSKVSRDKLISIIFNRAKKHNITKLEAEVGAGAGKSFSFDFNKFKNAIEYVKTNVEGRDYVENLEYIQDIVLCFFSTIELKSKGLRLPSRPFYYQMKPVFGNYINGEGFNKDRAVMASKKAVEAAEARYGRDRNS